jgi:hypothetical protein
VLGGAAAAAATAAAAMPSSLQGFILPDAQASLLQMPAAVRHLGNCVCCLTRTHYQAGSTCCMLPVLLL